MKKWISLSLILCMLLAAVGCSAQTPAPSNNNPTTSTPASQPADNQNNSKDVLVLKLGTQSDPTHYSVKVYERLNEVLEELSGGTMRIEIITNGQLGSIAEQHAQVKAGTQDLVSAGWTNLSLLPGGEDCSIFCLPFLFDDYDHVMRFVESDLFANMNNKVCEANGMHYIGVLHKDPIRELTTAKKPVYTLSDLSGLVIRVPSTPLQTQVWLDFGANATQSNYADLLDGMQTGRFDGQENGLTLVSTGALAYQDYYMELNHTFGIQLLYLSTMTWNKMTEEQRGWFEEAYRQVYIEEDYLNYVQNVMEPQYREELESLDNITIIPESEIDRQSFIDCVSEHMSDYEGEYFSAGLYDQIRAMAN